MNITLNIDSKGYTQKPTGTEAGAISNRLRCQTAITVLEPAELMEYITRGYTFTPAQIGGDPKEYRGQTKENGKLYTCSDFWINQQVLVADIDNDTEVIDPATGEKHKEVVSDPITPAEALAICRGNNIEPAIMYRTFSYTEEWQRFRVVIVLDRPITDFEQAREFIGRFSNMFNSTRTDSRPADTSIEPVKIIYGSTADSMIYTSDSITPIEAIEALPPATNTLESSTVALNEAGAVKQSDFTSNSSRGITSDFTSLQLQLRDDIRSFDIGAYIEQVYGCRRTGNHYNPCPICSHNDCLEVTGSIYRCFSSNHPTTDKGKIGGDIITFLQQADNLSLAAAMEKFKFDVMGYNKQEWIAAWKEEHKQIELQRAHEVQEIIDEQYNNPADRLEDLTPPPEQEQTATPAEQVRSVTGFTAAEYLTGGKFDYDIAYLQQFAGRKMGLHPAIDKHLTLYAGLAVLGGQASLGKTTFAVNMVSKLLDRGEHVLYFAFEQTAVELMTKTIASYIYHKNPDTLLTNIDIKNGCRDTETAEAIAEIAEQGNNYTIYECDFETTVADVIADVSLYMKLHPSIKPVVIIDYLQLIAPPVDFRGSTREYMDYNLKALKGYQKQNGLFVMVISSFNRSSYLDPVSYESFKETGMIESTCDYVWGLQLSIQDVNNDTFYTKEGARGGIAETTTRERRAMIQAEQVKKPKAVEFVSLKSRGGKQVYEAHFNYYPQHDYYCPADDISYTDPAEDLNSDFWNNVKVK